MDTPSSKGRKPHQLAGQSSAFKWQFTNQCSWRGFVIAPQPLYKVPREPLDSPISQRRLRLGSQLLPDRKEQGRNKPAPPHPPPSPCLMASPLPHPSSSVEKAP